MVSAEDRDVAAHDRPPARHAGPEHAGPETDAGTNGGAAGRDDDYTVGNDGDLDVGDPPSEEFMDPHTDDVREQPDA